MRLRTQPNYARQQPGASVAVAIGRLQGRVAELVSLGGFDR